MLTLLLICLHYSTWSKSPEAAISRYLNLELTDGCLLQGESYFLKFTAQKFYLVKKKMMFTEIFLSIREPGSYIDQRCHFCVNRGNVSTLLTAKLVNQEPNVPVKQNKFLHALSSSIICLPFIINSFLLRDLPSSVFP